jgi:hypothetical protein
MICALSYYKACFSRESEKRETRDGLLSFEMFYGWFLLAAFLAILAKAALL